MAVSRGKMLGGFTRGPGGRKCQCCQDPDTTRWRKGVERREVAAEIAGEVPPLEPAFTCPDCGTSYYTRFDCPRCRTISPQLYGGRRLTPLQKNDDAIRPLLGLT